MDQPLARIATANKALRSLQELANLARPSPVERDAAIQRFDYTFEATWKAARHFLLESEGVNAASPKAAVRASMDVGLLDESECVPALRMADDRNLAVLTYNEPLAERIFSRMPPYAHLLGAWLERMGDRLA